MGTTPPPTQGPIVDRISRFWCQRGETDGRVCGEAIGFNRGVRAILAEFSKNSPSPPPPGLIRDETEQRKAQFLSLYGEPSSGTACLEQIWYDIGYEIGKQKAYADGLQQGIDAAYDYLSKTYGKLVPRKP